MIQLEVSNYCRPYDHLNGLKNQNVTPLDVARAMITVGKGSWGDVYNLGLFRIGELLCKSLAFCELNRGDLVMNNRFYKLNQSEKATVSYYFGQALTKLYAEKYLNIKWLFHVDDYPVEYHSNGIANSKIIVGRAKNTAKRPDLIGLEKTNNSHIFEAKGNSGGYNTGIMQHAINQVSQVKTYNGVAPLTRTACFYDLSNSPIKGIIIDPENDGKGIDIEFNEQKSILKYYSFFKENKKNFSPAFRIDGYNFLTTPVGIPNIHFGFDERILDIKPTEILENGLYPKGWNIEQKISSKNGGVTIGLDGIILLNK